jgi:hypothetical protein
VGGADRDTVRRLALELNVPEGELREILEYATPYPSVPALAAIVAAYGVDAGWLLTGKYSPSTHRADEEREEPARTRVARLIHELQLPGASG